MKRILNIISVIALIVSIIIINTKDVDKSILLLICSIYFIMELIRNISELYESYNKKKKFFYCADESEGKEKCTEQCDHCKEYYKPIEDDKR